NRIIFVTAYKKVHNALISQGYESLFIPMTVDTTKLPKAIQSDEKRIIYFGNVMRVKREGYTFLSTMLNAMGWKLDRLSNNYYKGQRLHNQQEVWSILSNYSYGIGVGRCALEMLGMGMKV